MAAITAIELNKSTLSLAIGGTETLTVTKTPVDGEGTITWQSSDADIASVDDGVVTAVAAGTATITASAGEDITATCTVTVTEEEGSDSDSTDDNMQFLDDGKIPYGVLYINTKKVGKQ